MTSEEPTYGGAAPDESSASNAIDLSVIERVAAALDDQPGGAAPSIDFDPERSTHPLPARRR
jgi:hypothetical protein